MENRRIVGRLPGIYAKDKELQRILDKLSQNQHVTVPTNIARGFGHNKTIKQFRKNIRIAEDRQFRESIIIVKEPLKIKKNGDKYFFTF